MEQSADSNSEKVLMDQSLFLTSRKTIASYPGGKSDRRKHSTLFLSVPDRIPYLIEPFAGLANFFLVLSPRVSRAWLNDKDPEIFSILKSIQDPYLLSKLIDQVKSIEPIERDDYYAWKSSTPDEILERAIKRLIVLNCSPNGAGGGYSREKAHRNWYRSKPPVWRFIHKIFREKEVRITNWDYSKVLTALADGLRPRSSFCYLDPPYIEVAKSGNLYGKLYNIVDWGLLKFHLNQVQCHWILSNRDDARIHELFTGYHILQYNTYNDMNNTLGNNPEMLVSNLPFEATTSRRKLLEAFLDDSENSHKP
ncbi:MAG: DNA adenine methylase [Candidatus Thorarchaeota archaeon]